VSDKSAKQKMKVKDLEHPLHLQSIEIIMNEYDNVIKTEEFNHHLA